MAQEDINRQAFREEAHELLVELENALLELEDHPDDHDIIDRVFRAMHTIKGSGSMFGFDDIAAFTHEVETVFDNVRNNVIKVTKPLLDLTLAARDNIQALLHAYDNGEEPDLDQSASIVRELRKLVPDETVPQASDTAEDQAEEEFFPDDGPSEITYRVRFKPSRKLFLTGSNPLGLVREVGELGNSMVYVHFDDLPRLEEMDAEECYFWWDIILTTTEPVAKIKDVFLFVEDECELIIQIIDKDGQLDSDQAYKRLGEILVERGDISAEDLRKVLEERKMLGDVLHEKGIVSKEKVDAALREQETVRQIRETRTKTKTKTVETETASSIRVSADKLDSLVDLVGELVIVQAQISQVVGEIRHPSLLSLSEELERLSDELRDSTLSIRMLPIGTTFSKFRRLVRDLSAELGKEIELATHGAETELDKTVIERLNDPLVHLLRNSIDHGIEVPEARRQAGKGSSGTILLSAEHSGGEVLIQIKDDGKGIDAEGIRRKAVERGLISADAELSEKECFNLIFLPGFSTAEQVTNVSGRGVGMDVVKRGIDSLRGSVVVDSELGKGSTITIRLPLTLAIIDGLQVQVGDEFYVVPLSLVEECVELIRKEKQEERGREQRIVNLRGEIVPYIRLREWFCVDGQPPPIEQIVVARVDAGSVGIVVDHVIGEHQTVIKSLGRVFKDVQGISGATIKGDGSMALILDVPKIVETVAFLDNTDKS